MRMKLAVLSSGVQGEIDQLLSETARRLQAEGVRLALEKDPFIEAGQIRVGVRGTVVTLAGVLPSEAQRHMAECDAWCK